MSGVWDRFSAEIGYEGSVHNVRTALEPIQSVERGSFDETKRPLSEFITRVNYV
jgi:hypothetical protein